MNRKVLVYLNGLGTQWYFEVWYGDRLAVIGGAATQAAATHLAGGV